MNAAMTGVIWDNIRMLRAGHAPLADAAEFPLYLAAPYSASTREGIEANVAHAVAWWRRLTDAGYFVLCPHTSDVLDTLSPGLSAAFYYDYTMRMMRLCAGVVLIPDGPMPRMSTGVVGEDAEATRLGMPVLEAEALLP